ncbi:MAG: 30S ribosomal protein S17e [Nanoarchaeota archaeon]
MGRIKPLMVKKAAADLFVTVEGFSEDFEKNKKLLKDTMPSKKVRNKVAGGIVGLAKKKRLKEHGKQSDRE